MPTRTRGRRLVELIAGAHALDDVESFRLGIPALLRDAVPAAEAATYAELKRSPARLWWSSEPYVPVSEELGLRFGELAGDDPVIGTVVARRGQVRRLSDYFDRRTFHRTRLYGEFYRELGIEHMLGTTLPVPSRATIGLVLTRGEGEDFDDEDAALLRAALPHLTHAYRRADLITSQAATIAALQSGIEALGSPALVVEADGAVTMATPQAEALLERRLGENGSARRLAPDVRETLARHRRTGRFSTTPVRVDDGDRTLVLRALAVADRDIELLIVEPAAATLSVIALQGLGLTRREAETMRWIALGRRGTDIARLMSISPRTVEKHLENAYAKLGVRTVSEASAAVWAAVGTPGGDTCD